MEVFLHTQKIFLKMNGTSAWMLGLMWLIVRYKLHRGCEIMSTIWYFKHCSWCWRVRAYFSTQEHKTFWRWKSAGAFLFTEEWWLPETRRDILHPLRSFCRTINEIDLIIHASVLLIWSSVAANTQSRKKVHIDGSRPIMVRFTSKLEQKNGRIAENRLHMNLGKVRFIWVSLQLFTREVMWSNKKKGKKCHEHHTFVQNEGP